LTEKPALLEVGRIEKAHGLRGDVIVKLSTNVVERVAPGSVLVAGERQPRTLEVVRSQPHQHRFIVTFAGVNSKEDADALHGKTLYAEPLDDDDPETLWVHELIGQEVVEIVAGAERSHGRVAAVIDNPASDILELENGGLVPLRFVVDHSTPGRLVIEPPPGLLDDDDGTDDA
jgi:16S rRNA processing protein RimM